MTEVKDCISHDWNYEDRCVFCYIKKTVPSETPQQNFSKVSGN